VMAELRIPVLAAVPSHKSGSMHKNGNGHGNGNGNGNTRAYAAGNDAPFEVSSKPRNPNAQDRRY